MNVPNITRLYVSKMKIRPKQCEPEDAGRRSIDRLSEQVHRVVEFLRSSALNFYIISHRYVVDPAYQHVHSQTTTTTPHLGLHSAAANGQIGLVTRR